MKYILSCEKLCPDFHCSYQRTFGQKHFVSPLSSSLRIRLAGYTMADEKYMILPIARQASNPYSHLPIGASPHCAAFCSRS
jgi:hypothetical protein